MVETAHITPPDVGPQSDPLLYGVTQALEQLFPLDETMGSPASQRVRKLVALAQDNGIAGRGFVLPLPQSCLVGG